MDSLFLLTQNSNAIMGPIAKGLGLIMNGIYVILDDFFNIQNIALTIIIFTLVVYLCMMPLTYKQQKFSKMSQVMNPEIQAIQKKYKGRKDQASVQAMNEETQAVYAKYGVSPSGSCVFMVIQLLILFPLYRVIYNVPAYVTRVKESFADVVNGIMGTSGYQDIMTDFYSTISANNSVMKNVSLNFDGTTTEAYDSIIDVLYKCTSGNWSLLAEKFSGISDIVTSTQSTVEHFNNFLGASIVYSPRTLISTGFQEGQYFLIFIAILIPAISAGSQFLSMKLVPQQQNNGGQQEAMASQMKMMNYFMPIYSLFIVFFLPVGVGIYWIAGAVIRVLQQIFFNRHFDRMDLAEVVKKNQKKAEAKAKVRAEKKGVSGQTISNAASINTRQIDAKKRKTMAEKASSASKASYSDGAQKKYKEGSMAARANKVREYNEKNSR
ncbi:MAG: YidC/Oxa1 family membrane protein insertase [Lachnospiraceae bacterium]|nr:YidC/Oxa1 family membrane protein insertase [Lachnospiraceae bacterium]